MIVFPLTTWAAKLGADLENAEVELKTVFRMGLYQDATKRLAQIFSDYGKRFDEADIEDKFVYVQKLDYLYRQYEGFIACKKFRSLQSAIDGWNRGLLDHIYVDAYYLGWKWDLRGYQRCKDAYEEFAKPLKDTSESAQQLRSELFEDLADALYESPCICFKEPTQQLAAFYLKFNEEMKGNTPEDFKNYVLDTFEDDSSGFNATVLYC
ncbi:hypothetical protein PSACC_02312 [Paramicrosporidium saccamoebae]|uniref:Uncharacterized protein n=1 Tax=Paramicrosporidium saccamoebae TaxID=1246581 RepID=A0A2H9TJF2_9FUNG|nr:hypothetical protein PSACC_02312 [Paramicrosporidium saccamoebae]